MDAQKLILARLDRIPVWPYSYGVMLVVGFGFFFAFFDIVTIGLTLPVIIKQFHTSLSVALWCISSSLIGYIIGSFLDSRISDLFGRRLALILSLLFFSIGSIVSALSPNIIFLIILRFFIGMGIGSEIANVTTYIAELAPAAIRGRISSAAVALGFLGFAIVPFVGVFLIPNFTWGWRFVFGLGGLGALLIMFARLSIPESLRWHLAQGDTELAESLIQTIEAKAERRLKRSLPPVLEVVVESKKAAKGFMDLLKLPYLSRVVFFTTIWFFYYIGNYGWLTLNTKLFEFAGFNLRNSLWLVAVASIGFVVGSVIAIIFSDRFKRKTTIFITAVIWTIVLLVIGWWPNRMTIFICGAIASVTISILIPLLYTLTGESFPTACRATGISITDGIGHLGGAFRGQIILGVYWATQQTGLGYGWAFSTMALTGLLAAILVLFSRNMTKKALLQ